MSKHKQPEVGGPGIRVKSLTPKPTGVKVGSPGGKSGENADQGNRNKRS
jgi:hypothetical protein